MAQQHSGGVPLTVVSNVGDKKNGDFSTNISLYLGNGTRSSHNIHGVQIKKDATDFFRRNFYKYWRIFIIFRAQLHKRMQKWLA